MKTTLLWSAAVLFMAGCGGSSNPNAGNTPTAQQFPCINDAAVYEDATRSLLWLNDSNISTRSGDWQSARNYCLSLNHAGCDDRILPTQAQAQGAYNDGLFNPNAVNYNPINEYWLRDTGPNAGTHMAIVPSNGNVLQVSDTAPIGYGCVLYYGSDVNDIDQDGDGFTPNDGDCNDTSPIYHPGAIDISGDGQDFDCDGADD